MVIKIDNLIKQLKDSKKRTEFVDIIITKKGNLQIIEFVTIKKVIEFDKS